MSFDPTRLFASKTKDKDVADAVHTKKPKTRDFLPIQGNRDAWMADLMFLDNYTKFNKKNRMLLVCINIPSRYMVVYPQKTKTETTDNIIDLIEKGYARTPFLKESGFGMLEVDAGNEFVNTRLKTFLKEREILFISSTSATYTSLVERANGTLRAMIERYFSSYDTYDWLSVIDGIVDAYNTHKNYMGYVPADFNVFDYNQLHFANEDRKMQLMKTIEGSFKIGDHVLIRANKGLFEKGAVPNFGSTVYTVVGFVRNMYWKLEDAKGAEKTVSYDEGAAAPNPASKRVEKTVSYDDMLKVATPKPASKKALPTKASVPVPAAAPRQPLAAIKKERAVARVLTSVGIDAGNLVEGKRTRKAPMKLNL